jgi:hypothetical protein
MSVDNGAALEPRPLELVRVAHEELAEVEHLRLGLVRAFVVRQQANGFVAEDGDATRLEADNLSTALEFGSEHVKRAEQERLGAVEHSEIVERTTAAEPLGRHDDVKASVFENLDGGASGSRAEIVVERVGPEQHSTASTRTCAARAEPLLETLRRDGRNGALLRESGGGFHQRRRFRGVCVARLARPGMREASAAMTSTYPNA